jgi:hypothetical protein
MSFGVLNPPPSLHWRVGSSQIRGKATKGGGGMSKSDSEGERKDKLSILLLTKLKGPKHQVTWSQHTPTATLPIHHATSPAPYTP